MAVDGICSSGGGFLRRSCGRGAIGICVYCAEPFCGDHGTVHPDYYEVCNRKTCLMKFADVAAHLRWLEAHRSANDLSTCAQDNCEERMQHSCQRCRLRFCDQHLVDKTVTEHGMDGPTQAVQLLCPHCAARRVLWD